MIAATNFNKQIDSTLARRFKEQKKVGLPDAVGRAQILHDLIGGPEQCDAELRSDGFISWCAAQT